MRKARIDMGVEIKIDLTKLRQNPATGKTTKHYAVGTIEYPTGEEGIIRSKVPICDDYLQEIIKIEKMNPGVELTVIIWSHRRIDETWMDLQSCQRILSVLIQDLQGP